MDKEPIFSCVPSKEFIYQGDFKGRTANHLVINNLTDKCLLFKLKTTSPDKFAVKPPDGFIQPRQSKTISVNCLPFVYRPHQKYRDKFLIRVGQTESIKTESQFKSLWNLLPENKIQEQKLGTKYIYNERLPEIDEENESEKELTENVTAATVDEDREIMTKELDDYKEKKEVLSEESNNKVTKQEEELDKNHVRKNSLTNETSNDKVKQQEDSNLEEEVNINSENENKIIQPSLEEQVNQQELTENHENNSWVGFETIQSMIGTFLVSPLGMNYQNNLESGDTVNLIEDQEENKNEETLLENAIEKGEILDIEKKIKTLDILLEEQSCSDIQEKIEPSTWGGFEALQSMIDLFSVSNATKNADSDVDSNIENKNDENSIEEEVKSHFGEPSIIDDVDANKKERKNKALEKENKTYETDQKRNKESNKDLRELKTKSKKEHRHSDKKGHNISKEKRTHVRLVKANIKEAKANIEDIKAILQERPRFIADDKLILKEQHGEANFNNLATHTDIIQTEINTKITDKQPKQPQDTKCNNDIQEKGEMEKINEKLKMNTEEEEKSKTNENLEKIITEQEEQEEKEHINENMKKNVEEQEESGNRRISENYWLKNLKENIKKQEEKDRFNENTNKPANIKEAKANIEDIRAILRERSKCIAEDKFMLKEQNKDANFVAHTNFIQSKISTPKRDTKCQYSENVVKTKNNMLEQDEMERKHRNLMENIGEEEEKIKINDNLNKIITEPEETQNMSENFQNNVEEQEKNKKERINENLKENIATNKEDNMVTKENEISVKENNDILRENVLVNTDKNQEGTSEIDIKSIEIVKKISEEYEKITFKEKNNKVTNKPRKDEDDGNKKNETNTKAANINTLFFDNESEILVNEQTNRNEIVEKSNFQICDIHKNVNNLDDKSHTEVKSNDSEKKKKSIKEIIIREEKIIKKNKTSSTTPTSINIKNNDTKEIITEENIKINKDMKKIKIDKENNVNETYFENKDMSSATSKKDKSNMELKGNKDLLKNLKTMEKEVTTKKKQQTSKLRSNEEKEEINKLRTAIGLARYENIKLKEEKFHLDRKIVANRQANKIATLHEVKVTRHQQNQDEDRLIVILLLAVIGILIGKFLF